MEVITEPILYGWKDGGKHYWCGARDQGDVWQIAKPRANDLHPMMKPVELVERAIGNSSRRGDVVLDPFGGSGKTLIASERTSRRAGVIEVDPKYVDVIVTRWQDYTGNTAVLDGQDRTFDDIREAGSGYDRQPNPSGAVSPSIDTMPNSETPLHLRPAAHCRTGAASRSGNGINGKIVVSSR